MPRKGWKSISINEDTLNRLDKLADKTHRSRSNLIDYLVDLAMCKDAPL